MRCGPADSASVPGGAAGAGLAASLWVGSGGGGGCRCKAQSRAIAGVTIWGYKLDTARGLGETNRCLGEVSGDGISKQGALLASPCRRAHTPHGTAASILHCVCVMLQQGLHNICSRLCSNLQASISASHAAQSALLAPQSIPQIISHAGRMMSSSGCSMLGTIMGEGSKHAGRLTWAANMSNAFTSGMAVVNVGCGYSVFTLCMISSTACTSLPVAQDATLNGRQTATFELPMQEDASSNSKDRARNSRG